MRGFADLGCLVTGASSGIGAALARLLAREHARLVLTARRRDRLETLRQEILTRGAKSVHLVVEDLRDPDSANRILAESEGALGAIDLLVNNAGFGMIGPFGESDLDRAVSMLQVNVEASLRLVHGVLPAMRARGRGMVLNVSSIAGFQAVPFEAVYAGTKAFLLTWSESLHQELKRDGILVTALCPGVTDTEFFDVAGSRDPPAGFFALRQSAEDVARAGLRALKRGRMTAVSGPLNRTLLFLERLTPRAVTAAVSRRLSEGTAPRRP